MGEHLNPDGSVSAGVVLEVGGKPLGLGNGLPSATAGTTGMLANVGDVVILDCPGTASAMIAIAGNFVGTLRFRGAVDIAQTALGGRLLFKSGVGSLGLNTIACIGPTNSEYRIVTGGQRIVVDVTAATSGSVAISLLASSEPSLVFINGPVHTAVEEANRAGRAFTASTSLQNVAASNYLNMTLSNPSTSGVNMFITERFFDSNVLGSATPLEYYGITNPTVNLPSTPSTVQNTNGGNAASAALVLFGTGTARIDTSPSTTAPIGGVISPSGAIVAIERILRPGQSVGSFIGGAGGGIAATARCGIRYRWYEESTL